MSRADMQKRPDEVSAMFDDVAAKYDLTNEVLSAGNAALWRIATVKAVDPQPGEAVLDIAAGTGTSSAALAKRGAVVTALDLSEGMIRVGRERHPDITFVHGNAEELPFEDDTFDAVTISFGLRNVNDPMKALAEMYRVLKPGGRVVICEFSTPPLALLRVGYLTYLKRVLPGIAKLSSSNPAAYTYLAESIAAWPEQQVLSQWLRGVGFAVVAYRNLTAGIVALHRGRKPVAGEVRASAARRTRARRAHSTNTGTVTTATTASAAPEAALPAAPIHEALPAAPTPEALTAAPEPVAALPAAPVPDETPDETPDQATVGGSSADDQPTPGE